MLNVLPVRGEDKMTRYYMDCMLSSRFCSKLALIKQEKNKKKKEDLSCSSVILLSEAELFKCVHGLGKKGK